MKSLCDRCRRGNKHDLGSELFENKHQTSAGTAPHFGTAKTIRCALNWPYDQPRPRAMIAYVTVGADDIVQAKRFYDALLPALGYVLKEGPEGLSYILPPAPDQPVARPDFYVKPSFDGQAASAGNGAMTAFEAQTQRQVRALHAAALKAGGSDEGAPGIRASYGAHFYVGYLRDPQGNKIALFSNNLSEPGRPDQPSCA